VTLGPGDGPHTSYDRIDRLDLNGTTQRVYGITFNNYSYVTNTSSKRARLEIGEFATGSLSLNGAFGGPIDIVVKTKASLSIGSKFKLVGGARLTIENMELHNALSNIKGCSVNALVVSNWCNNVATYPEWIKNGAKRALPPSVMPELQVAPGGTVDIQGGVLDVAQFVGDAGASVHVYSNAALAVQAQTGRSAKYLRLVLKEAYGVQAFGLGRDQFFYPHLRQFALVKENGGLFWPVSNGFTYQTADTALADMPAGSYKFHSDKYAIGTGPDLDTINVPTVWPMNQPRTSDYKSFGNASFLRSDGSWGGLMFTNSVPVRSNAATWHTVTLRLKDDDMKFSGYRFVSNWDTAFYPLCWAVEVSDDGTNWTTLDEKTDHYTFGYSNGYPKEEHDDGYNIWNRGPGGQDFPFYWTTNVSETVSFALNGAKLRVDRGGLLDVVQAPAPAEVAWLEVDAQQGGGRITSFKPTANGVLNLVNVQTPGRLSGAERRVSFAFDQVVNPENISTWKVCIDGVEQPGVKVRLTDTGLQAYGWGLSVIVR